MLLIFFHNLVIISHYTRMLYARFGWNWPHVSRKDFKRHVVNAFIFTISIIYPWKSTWPFILKNLKFFNHGFFVQSTSIIEIGSSVLEKNTMWKVYIQINRWQAIRKAHLSFRWIKKNINIPNEHICSWWRKMVLF